jgi:hypothetical protein
VFCVWNALFLWLNVVIFLTKLAIIKEAFPRTGKTCFKVLPQTRSDVTKETNISNRLHGFTIFLAFRSTTLNEEIRLSALTQTQKFSRPFQNDSWLFLVLVLLSKSSLRLSPTSNIWWNQSLAYLHSHESILEAMCTTGIFKICVPQLTKLFQGWPNQGG